MSLLPLVLLLSVFSVLNFKRINKLTNKVQLLERANDIQDDMIYKLRNMN